MLQKIQETKIALCIIGEIYERTFLPEPNQVIYDSSAHWPPNPYNTTADYSRDRLPFYLTVQA